MDAHDVIKSHLGKDDPSFRIRDQNDLPIQGIFPEQFLVVDGTYLTKPPLEMVEVNSKADIPILIGKLYSRSVLSKVTILVRYLVCSV